MKEMIESSANKTIKYIKSLTMKKYRDEQDKFIIEGEKLIEEALNYKVQISTVLVSESFAASNKYNEFAVVFNDNNIPVYYTEDKIFKSVCETDTPQGILAVSAKPEYDIDSIISKDELSLILLNELRDPGNVGTIIRSADACGLDAVIISKGSVDLYNGKTIRATMGSLFHMPVIQGLDTQDTLEKLKNNEVITIGADPHSSESCIDLLHYKKSAIIIGNESQGINSDIKSILDINVKIPMPGRAESLNAGIAASILMYELYVRKRGCPAQ
ncbi:MAG: RNA methyltransferase [Clostridiaceae bacterium]|nr:RNA methyltransferase [Clostridiaceae bacterium]